MAEEADDPRVYRVVANAEEQHSVWLADRPLPAGWNAVGFTGSRTACLDYIEEVWTDIRPLSVRRALAADRAGDDAEP